LRHLPFQVFFVPSLSGDYKYPSHYCKFFFLQSVVLFISRCQLPDIASSYTLCQETEDHRTKQRVINRFQNWISTSGGVHLSSCYG